MQKSPDVFLDTSVIIAALMSPTGGARMLFHLAQAIRAKPDWFVSHDREHFLGNPSLEQLAFRIGSPGDLLAWLKENAGKKD